MRKTWAVPSILCLVVIVGLAFAPPASAASVAIVKGSYWTSDLSNALTGAGETVTEITTYTAASLAGYDAVIHYGNSFTDTTALATYVNGGGTLVLTPWAGWNFDLPASLQVFDNSGVGIDYSTSYPGVTVHDAGNPRLDGVTFPAGPGGFDIGRTRGIGFVAGADQIASWADGQGAMIGQKSVGLGTAWTLARTARGLLVRTGPVLRLLPALSF